MEQLTDDEQLVADTARQFAQEKLAPRVQEAYRDEQSDPAIFRISEHPVPVRRVIRASMEPAGLFER